jgi:hypothetical protein
MSTKFSFFKFRFWCFGCALVFVYWVGRCILWFIGWYFYGIILSTSKNDPVAKIDWRKMNRPKMLAITKLIRDIEFCVFPGRKTFCSTQWEDFAMHTYPTRPHTLVFLPRVQLKEWLLHGMQLECHPTRVRFVLCGPLPPTRLSSSSSVSPSHSQRKHMWQARC